MTAPSPVAPGRSRWVVWFPLLVAVWSAMLYARRQGASMLETIVDGVLVLAVAGLATWWLRQPGLVRRFTPTFGGWLRITRPASATWQPPQVVDRGVYLPITNTGGAAAFSAAVERMEGTADSLALPFSLRWRDGPEENRTIATNGTSLLHLVLIEPEGNVDEYPIEHGAQTKHSVEARVRGWKPGRFRFQGLSQEYAVFLDLGDVQPLTKNLRNERYTRRLRVTVRLRSSDGAVNEARAVVLGIREVGNSRHSWGADDAVVAEVE